MRYKDYVHEQAINMQRPERTGRENAITFVERMRLFCHGCETSIKTV